MFRGASLLLIYNRISSQSTLFSKHYANEFVHLSARSCSAVAAAEGNVAKEALMQLRKRTGYSISKCKQAVVKFGNDLAQAEEWLHDNARKEGWEKIGKRANVATAQGLLGMIVANGLAAVVEVNCQTDFVARNEKFRSLVAQISRGVFSDAATNYRLDQEETTSKWNLSFDRVSEKGLDFGETLPDLLASNVGHMGEKITVAGAYVMRVGQDMVLSGYMHPRSPENVVDGVPTGHFAALVAYRCGKDTPVAGRDQLGLQLCQHIIGMNPTGIGAPPSAEETTPPEEVVVQPVEATAEDEKPNRDDQQDDDDQEVDTHAQPLTKLSNETTLLRQDFLLEPDVTVHEYLVQNDASVIDFVRLERGAISAVHCKAT